MRRADPDRAHRTGRNTPIPDSLCGWGSCVFLATHLGPHSWETFGLVVEPDPHVVIDPRDARLPLFGPRGA